ncbi:MAG: MBL fold metallo-hydrolase [Vicinamibacterales bacterium]
MFDPILVHAHNPSPWTGDGNNTYLLVGRDGRATLIDAGQGIDAHLEAVDDHLRRHSSTLDQVLVTHGHLDHVSGAPHLRRAHPHATFRKRPWIGQDPASGIEWRDMADGERVDVGGEMLVALHTPGHAPDHVAFWHEPSGVVFVGDLVMARGSVMIHASRGGDLAAYLASLERIRALAPGRLLPAHGDPIDDPDAVLTRYIAHRYARETQVLAALTAGKGTVPAIAESIYDGLNPALLPAAHETVRAHLEKLRREGRASTEAGLWSAC